MMTKERNQFLFFQECLNQNGDSCHGKNKNTDQRAQGKASIAAIWKPRELPSLFGAVKSESSAFKSSAAYSSLLPFLVSLVLLSAISVGPTSPRAVSEALVAARRYFMASVW